MQAADHNLILSCLPYVETAAEVKSLHLDCVLKVCIHSQLRWALVEVLAH